MNKDITRADELLVGALDMHAHGYPQFSANMPCRLDDYDWALEAKRAGMAGFVIKSHMWPTTTSAYMINKLVPGIKAYGSITLNPIAGGLNPVYVQMAAECGAKVVFMPTWKGKNDVDAGNHFFNRMRPTITRIDEEAKNPGLYLLDDNDRIKPEVDEILDVCKEYDCVVATGHISKKESLKLCERASLKKVKFIFTHPLLAPIIDASNEEMKLVADMGGYIENVFIGCMPMHQQLNPRRIFEAIKYVGPEHCVMSSDAIEGWNPPAPEVLHMYISTMLNLGLTYDEVYTMTHTNPAYLLGYEYPKETDIANE